ncbi:hypothetical protein N866_19435 [Actinotalea ferrariae CF5-4]|uniref:Uncharacterized protein n=1 Tax=Actinotalea ferrariae CF5-4 TaxID=948458 RepID=A0A021VU68_9CELL|nr:DUF5317 family protein [Actinotalea ferrariae]EYR63590.1 hypothetical protein N866_19435 [Actinotalea ferrariae CF5-4]
MLLLAACLLAVLSPLVVGRWPAGLLLHRWRLPLLVWATLLLQAAILEAPLPEGVARVGHVLTYGGALAFLWLNRRVPGALLVGAGAASNGLTIALNGGVLPADPDAVAATGRVEAGDFANSAVVADPVLPWLGDAFAWPAPLPLANTFSIGDVLVLLGVVVAAWTSTRRLGRPAPTPDDDRAAVTPRA